MKYVVPLLMALLAGPLLVPAAAQQASTSLPGSEEAPTYSRASTHGQSGARARSEGPLSLSTSAREGKALHHVVGQPATMFMQPDSSRPYLKVDFREPLYLVEKRPRWSRVRTADGAEGFVRSHAISNVWIRVSKEHKRVYLYEGTRRLMAAPADFGYNVFLDKRQRGSNLRRDDWRTPEGTLYVVRKNPHSQFYRAFVLNYPTAEDAERGLERGLISQEEYRAIVEAQKALEEPPMDTALGGMIEIHGEGTGAARNWTRGCVAIHNRHLRQMWHRVEVGTPVVIE